MAKKKYITLDNLSKFLDLLKGTFSPIDHTHESLDFGDAELITVEDIDDICGGSIQYAGRETGAF